MLIKKEEQKIKEFLNKTSERYISINSENWSTIHHESELMERQFFFKKAILRECKGRVETVVRDKISYINKLLLILNTERKKIEMRRNFRASLHWSLSVLLMS